MLSIQKINSRETLSIMMRNSSYNHRFNMLVKLIVFGLVLAAMAGPVRANVIKLPSLHWNSNNRLFKDPSNSGNNYYLKMNAHIGDSIDLTCPKSTINTSDYEYSVIYKVSSKHEFDNCIVNPNNYETVPILKCDKPGSVNPVKFTIYFVKYSPVPNALEFEEDKEYYFLSASSGTRDGLGHMSGGLCSRFNMRFSIKIKPQSSEISSSVILNKLSKGGEHASSSAHNQVPHGHHATATSSGDNNTSDKSSTSKLTKLFASLVSGTSNTDNNDTDGQDDSVDVDSDVQRRDQPQVSKLNLVVSSTVRTSSSRSSLLFYFSSFFLAFVLFKFL
jgi:hypothetical protein